MTLGEFIWHQGNLDSIRGIQMTLGEIWTKLGEVK